jgi:hypothetical protein
MSSPDVNLAHLEGRYAPSLRAFDGPLVPEALMAEAEHGTGLSDWGGPDFGEAGFRHRLGVICQSMETEAALNAVGRSRAHSRLYFNLCGRLSVIDWHRRHPGQPPILDPLIGTGLSRAGTSFFHQLLAQDPDNITGPMAACMIPTPPPGDEAFDTARYAFVGRLQDFHGLRAPEIEAVHPFQPENAAECLAMQASAIGTEYQAFFSIPTFIKLANADAAELLKWEMAVMQVLQNGASDRRWLLKTPHHMAHLDPLIEVFPKARLFFNHGDPAKVIPSICNLFKTFYGLNTDRKLDIDLGALAKGMCAGNAATLARVTAWREAHREVTVVDVHYKQMTADPIGEAERVYDAFGLKLSAKARGRMSDFLKVNRHAHGPKHDYSLADFGLTEQDVEDALGPYLDAYGVQRERG